MANKKQEKIYNICVVGLSGYDVKEKCLYGVGKSCFCNRFVRSKQDEYYPDHNSIYSTSDFVGTVLNSDHFLYWGKVEKVFDENTFVSFRIIEHTEFIDDASCTPLSRSGQLVPYHKRATATKLASPGKIKYISRDQVALQYDYEQVHMDQDGKIQVHGFICIYDVSQDLANKTNLSDLQEDILSSLLTSIHKAKKPVVFVASKCDESTGTTLQRAHNFVHMKKISTPLIEASAEINVNIDLGFQALIPLMDTKSRFRTKLISFQEGLNNRNDMLNKLSERYLGLIKSTATDSSLLMSWAEFKKQHNESVVFIEYCDVCGLQQARKIFNQQAKKIRTHYEDKKLNEFLNKLPDALNELLPSLQSIEANEWKWELCQQAIKNHILFDKWFLVLENGETWNSPERLFSNTDTRIPFDVLQVERARACFDRHIKKLNEAARKMHMRNDFRKLLECTPEIQPGTNWLDASDIIAKEESYRYLDEQDRKVIFEKYLRDITLRAKLEFQELLFESANKFSKLSKDARPSEMEMNDIYTFLQNDLRYKHLENVGNTRDILLFNHIALMQSPTRCLSGPEKCMDRLMQQVVETTARRNVLNPYENELFRDNEDECINLLIIGNDGLGEELEERIKMDSSSFDCVEIIVDGQIYGLNLKVFDDESDNYEEELIHVIADFKPQGYLAIFSQQQSYTFVDNCLRKIVEYESTSNMALPLIILLANESGREGEIQNLRCKGQNLANRMECIFIDYPYTVSLMDDPIHDSQVHDSMRGIIDIINRRTRPAATPTGCAEENADIRVLLCAMCGDEYPVELILSTMVQHHLCYSNPDQQDTIMLEAVLGGARRTISVTLGSYHRAYSLKNQLFHGCILVYSATRLASLETLRAYSSTLHRELPVQMLAVTGSASGASIIFHEENAKLLLNDGSNIFSKLSSKLQQSMQSQAGQFLAFFNNIYNRKLDTELILQGIKRRRQEPLPAVPGAARPTDLIPNGSIAPDSIVPPDSPYVEVALRHSFIMHHVDSDSSPSSPDRHQITTDRHRSRSSTMDSFEVEHDESGLYAKVNKKSFTYIKKVEKQYSDEDEDDDLIWQENMAYVSNNDVEPHHVSIASNLDLPKDIDRPYATVPFLPKGHKSMVADYNKFATMPAESSKKGGWNEPLYASIEQVKGDTEPSGQGYDAGSLSSISSKSKESSGSQLDIHDLKSSKTPLTSPASGANLQQLWMGKNDENLKSDPPIAKPDDDEAEDIKELRSKLVGTLSMRRSSADQKKKEKEKNVGKKRTDSSISTNSLDPKGSSIIKKFMSKVSPNPSPGNSDVEHETPEVLNETPTKKRKYRSFKRSKNSSSAPSNMPAVVVNDVDSMTKERSNTLPGEQSPKHTPKFSSLDHKKSQKSLFKKLTHDVPELASHLATPELEKFQSLTLDRKKSKKVKAEKVKGTKDDLYLNLGDQSSTERKRKPKPLSMRFPKASRPRGPRKRGSDMSKKVDDWQKNQSKNQKFKNSNYFGKNLNEISPSDASCPIFVKSVITYVELNGMESEGIYRMSGNKHDIEAVMQKFDANNHINLQEMGVSVHAVTGALKQFFKMLPDPLIPYTFGSKINEIMVIMDAAERLKKLQLLVKDIPQPNLEVFGLFMRHLHRVTEHKLKNKMDVRNLQTVLYPTLLRPNFDSLQNMSQNMNMGLFIQTCIEQSDKMFGVCDKNDDIMLIHDEKEQSEEFDLKPSDDDHVNSDSGTNCDDNDALDNQPTSVELSFSESVLSDALVESVINIPPVVELHLDVQETDKAKKRRSFETAIY